MYFLCFKCSGEAVLSFFSFKFPSALLLAWVPHHALLSVSFVCGASVGTVFTSAGAAALLASVVGADGFSSMAFFLCGKPEKRGRLEGGG